MSHETVTTSNGHEIEHPTDIMDAEAFRTRMAEEYGLTGETPHERIEQLKQLSVEGFSILLQDINKSLQGSEDSLITRDKIIKIGEQPTIPLEQRYDVFLRLVEDIKAAPRDVNPARVGDVLAMGELLLHPFEDGNGRTARAIGFLFRDDYDQPEYPEWYAQVTESRDKVRERNRKNREEGLPTESMIYGYVPQFPEGFDQSDGEAVSRYLSALLYEDAPESGSYYGCFGTAPLHE